MKLEKTDMESDIAIFLGEGVKPDSFLIASIKKDIAYLDEQMAQKEVEATEDSAKSKKLYMIAGAAAAVTTVTFLSCF